MNRKLQAFTLIEVTLVMILVAISIGISYSAYSLFNKLYMNYNEKIKFSSGYLFLGDRLEKDLQRSKQAATTENGFSVTDTAGIIRYAFFDDFITRDQYGLRVDTFFFKNRDLNLQFEGEQINVSDNLMDEVSFELLYAEKWTPVCYQKMYSSLDLFEMKQ